MSFALNAVTQTIGNALRADTSGLSWADGAWWEQLQPGSWRGVGFVLDAGDTRAGRRVAIHEYPYRDTAWAEDLGRLPRRFSVQAFLVGDDVYQQRDAMLAACEQPGVGTLVHPTLGSIACVLLEFQSTDRRERGRMVELGFTFIVAGDVQYPTTILATGANVLAMSGALNLAARVNLTRTLQTIGAGLPPQVTACVGSFVGLAGVAVDDPTRALNAVRGLQGYYGRFAAGSRQTLLPATATVPSVLAAGVRQRSAVLAAGDQLNRSVEGL